MIKFLKKFKPYTWLGLRTIGGYVGSAEIRFEYLEKWLKEMEESK